MADKPIKIPGPDHPIILERSPARIVVTAAGRVIADTTDALALREAAYKPVHYIPRRDVDMTALVRSETSTYCPYKGDAAYFSVAGGTPDAIWTYEAPFEAVAAIKDRLAFYPDRVDSIEERQLVEPT